MSNDWPDTDEDHLYLTYAVNDSDEEPTPDSDFIWALYDSGSGLTTCPMEMFEDVEIVPGCVISTRGHTFECRQRIERLLTAEEEPGLHHGGT